MCIHIGPLCLSYESQTELRVHQAGQQAYLHRSHFVNTFFETVSLTEPGACPSGNTGASKPLGSACLCTPARRLKVHTIVSGLYVGPGDPHFMHVWQTLHPLRHLPSPAETKTQELNLHALYMILSLQRNSEIQNESWLLALFSTSCYADINRHNSFLPQTLF